MKKYLIQKVEIKAKNHCQFSSKYGGSAHNTCNLWYKLPG